MWSEIFFHLPDYVDDILAFCGVGMEVCAALIALCVFWLLALKTGCLTYRYSREMISRVMAV